jgi:hypothetical protein
MKNKYKQLLIVLSLTIIANGCSQIYDPHLENTDDILVVEGHLTNCLETYSVKLSLTSSFNSSIISNPVSGAKVWVLDNKDRSIFLYSETSPGNYIYDPELEVKTGNIGHIYTLHIETSDGNIYESSPEMMSPPAHVDSIYGIKKNKAELIESPDGGSLLYENRTYIDIISDIQGYNDSIPKVRFKPGWIYEMINYHRDVIGGPPPPPTYTWKYTIDSSLCISEATNTDMLNEQYSGSLLTDNLSGLYEKQNLQYIILVMNFYYLNNDSYSIFNDMKEQLSANDALFDPISQVIKANIKCLNNPEKPVAGLFDVASHEVKVYFVTPNLNSPPVIKQAGSFHEIPSEAEGITEGVPPSWWFD